MQSANDTCNQRDVRSEGKPGVALRRAITSTDVARRAGVSRSVVSTVLNGAASTARISAATQQRVLEVARELGYRPNIMAQSLRRSRVTTLAFLSRYRERWWDAAPLHQILPQRLASLAARAAEERGFHLIELHSEAAHARSPRDLTELILSRRIGGVIVDIPHEPEMTALLAAGLSAVQLFQPVEAIPSHSIIVDPVPGVSAAATHLVDLGHRTLAFIGHKSAHPVIRLRLDAFASTLSAAGVTLQPAHIVLCEEWTAAAGYRALHRLLRTSPRPTAILIGSDNLSLGVLQALYDARLRVPDDMSLVTYDDLLASTLYPPLSAVAQPFEEMAVQAVETLTQDLRNEQPGQAPFVHIAIPSRFTVRRSTASPPETSRDDSSLRRGD
ncbi:MAG: LacI family transcriptional regulator [Chloroflexi bacterium]|nr:LacI family transcriptional regulator [Chloroflexota bacterium]